ncbi:MAG: tRNA preQ1(34) S-adenosylmethionine ribosyltransferase-isomerase QueA [Chloroflexi bacterium]|nr:MAG: tRNA preQ1(34) S-adenosylmethionine ribosyltransferase-isomerase QueA [Chloroflexota bacterium]MBL1196206.1 tRNA preQ1(34) S-adenosylmethionine ribosyltransferase-isomerase QueA [Chloroflexota bacterium]NOH13499.1 tRNA preQ1(34) S-adenosylmethionine ribosyltransferase-isomerase QueA [Chloroflexota bacterium]
MRTDDFNYHLPPERIAQTPVEPRHASRLLVLNQDQDELTHTHFANLGDYLNPGDLLVVNQTRVIPARLYAKKVPSGGRVELLLLNRRDDSTWEALIGGKRMVAGKAFTLENGIKGEVIEELDGPRRLLRFAQPIDDSLEELGEAPLPPYIHTPLNDAERYQTVYAREAGSAAAPTAGLHFTPELMSSLKDKGVGFAEVTLHVGLDTFAPVHEDDPREHAIHSEWCQLTKETADKINAVKENGGRVVAVGTTSVRVLESATRQTQTGQSIAPYEGATSLYILPGYEFKVVDAIITNFHLPRSTLLMMISAFAGRDRILHAYATAIEQEYRFYSFGDAMLIL